MKRETDDLTTNIILRLNARGLEASIWRMGGNVLAAGIVSKHCPPGIHLGIGHDASGEAQACLFVGWDEPATEAEARARLTDACLAEGPCPAKIEDFDGEPEDGGDDTLVLVGSVGFLVGVAVAFTRDAKRPLCLTCWQWNDDNGECGICANCARPDCTHDAAERVLTTCDRANVIDLLKEICANYDEHVTAHVNAVEILTLLGVKAKSRERAS